MSRGHGIEIRALPAGTKPSVDRSAAVATALFLVDRTTGDYLMAATGAI